jgi:hypothetical protein
VTERAVTYRIAQTPEEYQEASALALSEGMSSTKMKFPVILAYDGKAMVGILGTHDRSDMVIAGPLVFRGDENRLPAILTAIDLYDMTMKYLGIQTYVFSATGRVKNIIEKKYGHLKPYATNSDGSWYIRKVPDGRST